MSDESQIPGEKPSEQQPESALRQQTSPATGDNNPGNSIADNGSADSAPAARPGRLLASLALLLALAGVSGVAYLYYLLVYQDPLAQVAAQQQEAAQTFADMSAQLTTTVAWVRNEYEEQLQQVLAAQEQRLADNETQVLKTLHEALQAAPPSQRKWKLAEAEYLLRIANHRVLMEQDANGALNLLQAADEVIAQLDDFSLHQVRARLADEIVALQQVRRDDLQGIYLRLQAVSAGLSKLTIETPEYLAEPPPVVAELTVWQTLAAELEKFVRVRTLGGDETVKPLLAPEEERFLELNLRLAIQQAQSAVLKRQQVVYESSLQSVRGWVEDYMLHDAAAAALLLVLDELLAVELARPLPDISGSLNELLTASGGNK